MVRFIFLHIMLLVAGISFAQDEYIILDVNPNTVEVGQSISVSIKTNVNGRMDMNLPDGFIQSGAMNSGMSSSVVYINGKQKRLRYDHRSFTGYFEEAGTYEIGPVIVETRDGEVKSELKKIKVIRRQNMISEDPSKNMNQAIFGIVEQSSKEIYEGEPLILEGKIYAQVEVLEVQGFSPFQLDGPYEEHLLVNPNAVNGSYSVINGRNIETYKIGKTLIYPEEIGEFKIKPFHSVLLFNDPRTNFPERAKILSNEASVKVKPLPEGTPQTFIGGVGSFDISASLSDHKIDQGKVVELKVKLTGVGNLHNVEKPKVKLASGMTFYGDVEVVDSINFSAQGSEGSKVFTYFIQTNRPGDIKLPPVEISYFDPIEEKYKTISCEISSLKVISTGEEIEEISEEIPEEIQAPTMQPLITEKIGEAPKTNPLLEGWKGAVLIFSPLMLGFLAGAVVRVNQENKEQTLLNKQRWQHRADAALALSSLDDSDTNKDQLKEITDILLGFLAKEFQVSKGEISRSFLKSKVPNEIDQDTFDQTIAVFDEVDAIKYGGKVQDSDVSLIKEQAIKIVKSFDK